MMGILTALLLTILIEAAITAVMIRGERRRRVLIDGAFINLVTNPIAHILVGALGLPFLLVEVLVVLSEAVLYRRVTRLPAPEAIRLSLVANTVTAALSFAL